MRLTERTDIAVRILLYLGLKNGQKVSIDNIVEGFVGHRSQVVAAVQQLRKAGYIASIPGRKGGVWLAVSPSEIEIKDLLLMFETDFHLTKCFGNPSDCAIHDLCEFKRMLDRALQNFFAELEGKTLQDMLVNQEEILQRIGADSPELCISKD